MKQRRPRGYRTSDDVHRALKIRAAETGETIEDILDRALRKELGMVRKIDAVDQDLPVEA